MQTHSEGKALLPLHDTDPLVHGGYPFPTLNSAPLSFSLHTYQPVCMYVYVLTVVKTSGGGFEGARDSLMSGDDHGEHEHFIVRGLLEFEMHTCPGFVDVDRITSLV